MKFCDGCGLLQTEPSTPASGQTQLELEEILRKKVAPVESARKFEDLMFFAVLFVATAVTIYPLFLGEFTSNWGSIESAYISDSSFVAANFPNVGWYPYWYGGLPFSLSYPPLLVYLVALLHAVSGLSISHSYRILTALAYSATPPTLYVLARGLIKKPLPSFFVGLTYSFVPTFLPAPAPSHIGALTVYGEGPHLFGLLLSFFALILLLQSLRKPSWFRCLGTSFLIASVALTNLVALYGLVFLMLVAVATEAIYKNDTGILTFIFCTLAAFGLITFQYTLEFIQSNAQVSAATAGGVKYSLLLLPLLILGTFSLRRWLSRPLIAHGIGKPWVFTGLWILLLGTIVIGRIWFQLPQLAPQPIRFVPEFDAGICILIGLILAKVDAAAIKQNLVGEIKLPSSRKVWIAGALLVLLSINVVFLLPLSLNETRPSTSLSNVPEVRVTNWLSQHVTDESVFATGSVAFWLDVFSNVRQLRGGSDQGATNSWWADVSYQILSGPDARTSILWAQAWNIKYIVVTYPNSSSYGNLDYLYPHKFDAVLPLRYYFEGQGIYEVPLPRPALVEAVSAASAESLTPISSVHDVLNIAAYDHLTQANPSSNTTITYANPHSDLMQISVRDATVDTGILVKVTFDNRWAADIDGVPQDVSRIGPDFMLVLPKTTGDYQLRLRLLRSDDETVGSYGTIATVVLLTAISLNHLYSRRRKRTERLKPPHGQIDLDKSGSGIRFARREPNELNVRGG